MSGREGRPGAGHDFDGVIEAGRGGGAYVVIPFDVKEHYGTGGGVKVWATFDGEPQPPYRGSMVPMGGGVHVIGVLKAIRESIGKGPGDTVHVRIDPWVEGGEAP